ncbi:hypothetical protein [Lactococcus lactis]|uniref:hypothetical protein n=1 Tax=Lactococcus lactis TaxID=1358 RepID=UPI00223B7F24|nr:hypothetical protein [Lactococcus lactis]
MNTKNRIATVIYLIFCLAVLLTGAIVVSTKVILILVGILALFGFRHLNKTHNKV